MLDEESFSVVIWALLYATIFAPFVFRWLLNRYVKARGLEGRGGPDARALAEEGDDSGAYSESHAEKGSKKLEYGNGTEDNNLDLAAIDVGAFEDGNMKPRSATPKLPVKGDSAMLSGKAAAASMHRSGNGFLCCLFFKRILV
mmetsp:Transcript_94854/g.263844  ORF Transcript_94854/g.263844 Transcript_94854/m.263844 type:complete len:143 (+) Transcript_94854:1-429(+)